MKPLLEGKNAVIYGAVARAFARRGVEVLLAGHTVARLDGLAEEMRAAGVSRA